MKNVAKYITLLISIIFLSNCSKDNFFQLERAPENPWNTPAEFEKAVIGVYSRGLADDGWNCNYVNWTLIKVSEADDVDWVNDPEWGYHRDSKLQNTYTSLVWVNSYQAIAGSNVALDFVSNKNNNPFPTASDNNQKYNVQRIIGELHFMRGYMYYLLTTMFGNAYIPAGDNSITSNIPLKTTFDKTATDGKTPHIGTVQEIYDFMISEFKKAKQLLPLRYDASVMNSAYSTGRANNFAAHAMLARVYFLQGDYAKSKAETDTIIDQNGGDYNLTEDPIAAFNKSTLDRGKEVIWWCSFLEPTGATPMHLTVLNHWAGDWGQCTWNEPRMANSTIKRLGWMNDPVNDTTINQKAYCDKRFTQLMAVRYPNIATHAPGKFYDSRPEISHITTIWNNRYYRGVNKFHTNVPIIRLAEMYLTRATCRLKAGDKAGAAVDLDVVRKRAWNSTLGGPFITTNSNTLTQQTIDDERLIEMFNEPDRMDYLRGLKVNIGPGDRNVVSEPYTSQKFIWAPPISETNYNINLK